MVSAVLFSSKTGEHATPQEFFDNLNREFGFTLDVAATPENAKCARYFTEKEDGLTRGWGAETVWCNPPYGRQIGDWVKKAFIAANFGATVVMLLPARTDTRWFHKYIVEHAELRFVRGRLKFGNAKNAAPFPSMVVVFRAYGGLGDGDENVGTN